MACMSRLVASKLKAEFRAVGGTESLQRPNTVPDPSSEPSKQHYVRDARSFLLVSLRGHVLTVSLVDHFEKFVAVRSLFRIALD